MSEEQEKIENSPKILFRYNKRCRWREGRLVETDNNMPKAIHKVYAFEENAKVLDWPNVLDMCNEKLAPGKSLYKFVKGWFFYCWLSPQNIKLQ